MISVKGYRILKKLGSGGMAIVYLAEHEKLGKKVAIKVLSDLLTSNSSVRKRFIQEARVMASLILSVRAAVQSLNFGPSSEQAGNIPVNVSMNLITSDLIEDNAYGYND